MFECREFQQFTINANSTWKRVPEWSNVISVDEAKTSRIA
jgi:hypothetical protein